MREICEDSDCVPSTPSVFEKGRDVNKESDFADGLQDTQAAIVISPPVNASREDGVTNVRASAETVTTVFGYTNGSIPQSLPSPTSSAKTPNTEQSGHHSPFHGPTPSSPPP